jgi:galactose mutarotase-like enzyme
MVVLENDLLKVQVNFKGAELGSIFNKVNGIEHLWQGDPSVWSFQSPNLFPIVGSCIDNELLIDGIKYPTKRHGFARHSLFELVYQNPTEASFRLSYNESTLEAFPYKFAFDVIYKLEDSKLNICYEVKNLDQQAIHFSLGAHPAFNIPLQQSEQMSDYYIQFNNDDILDKHLLSVDGFFTGQTESVSLISKKLFLSPDLFSRDALVFKELNSREVNLKSTLSNSCISVSFPDFTSLGIWAPAFNV